MRSSVSAPWLDGLRRLGEAAGTDGEACAAERGLRPHGRVSAGGSARIVEARDRLVCVNLPRRDDVEMVDAWLQPARHGRTVWETVEGALGRWDAEDAVDGAQLLGMPVAVVRRPDEVPPPASCHADRPSRSLGVTRTVVDLSSMWAGPLCGRLLAEHGHRVVKIEAEERPDGTRYGDRAFFDGLNAMKEQRALPALTLRDLVAEVDVVITSSRHRALSALGLDPYEWTHRRPDLLWVSITGYGLASPWVAFGDDAAAAGGLVHANGGEFAGDALADPAAGLRAAAEALQRIADGSGGVVDVSMRDAARSLLP